MPSVIFQGSKVKTLKKIINMNGGADIISSTTDPTLSAVDAPAGSLLLNETNGLLYRKLDAGSSTNWSLVGSGGGNKSYSQGNDSTFDTAVGGNWTTYAEGSAVPVDGQGPGSTLTLTRTTTTPLQGAGSGLVTPGALGNGAAFTFTIDRADFGRILGVSFDMEINTFASYTEGDMQVWVVSASDVGFTTNLQVTQPVGFKIQKIAGIGTHSANFQTHATNTYYKILIHQATAATGYTLELDNFKVGPNTGSAGTVKAPTVQNFLSGSGTYTAPSSPAPQYIRVRMVGGGGGGSGAGSSGAGSGGTGGASSFGSSLITANGGAGGTYAVQGAGGSGGSAVINTPALSVLAVSGGKGGGAAIYQAGSTAFNFGGGLGASSAWGGGAGNTPPNSAGLSGTTNTGGGGSGASGNGTSGMIVGGGGGSGGYAEGIISNPASSYSYAVGAAGTAGGAGTGGSAGGAGGSGAIIVEEFYGPPVSSNEGDGRVVAAIVSKGPSNPIPTGTIAFTTVDRDTHGAIQSNGVFTCPQSGLYYASTSLYYSASTPSSYVVLEKNNVAFTRLFTGNDNGSVSGGALVPCNAGDTLKFTNNGATISTGGNETGSGLYQASFFRLSGPAQISASEIVVARYTSSSGQTIATGVATGIDFATKSYDSHGAVQTGTWRFYAPIPGYYKVSVQLWTDNTTTSGYNYNLQVRKNAVKWGASGFNKESATSLRLMPQLSDTVQMVVGDYIDVLFQQNSGGNLNLLAAGTENWITIERVGGVA